MPSAPSLVPAPGTAYQVEYIGVASTPALSGWRTWPTGGDARGSAFTSTTTLWRAGLPILKWAIPESASVTRTLTVRADGSSALS